MPTATRQPNVEIGESQPATVGDMTFEVKRFMTAEIPDGGDIGEVLISIDGAEHSFVDGPEGYGSKVVWTETLRLELLGADTGLRGGAFFVDRITDDELADSRQELTLVRRGKVGLGDDLAVELRAVKPKDDGALVVTLRYHRGSNWDHAELVLSPSEMSWRWRDFHFLVTGHEPGKTMQVIVHRLALVPLV